MLSYWHSTILGQFDPQGLTGGLDYSRLFLSPVHAEATWAHETAHGVLCTTTEFGQATTTIYRALPKLNSLNSEEKKVIKLAFRENQLFLQEGSATLLQVLYLAGKVGKKQAIAWAKDNLPLDYLARFEELLFVFNMGQKYRELFTSKIAHLALHTGIRKKITDLDLLNKPQDFIAFLNDPENIPDVRFKMMVELIRKKPYLVLKPPEEIVALAGITSFPDPSKQDVADFMNYVGASVGEEINIKAEDIGSVKQGQEALLDVSEKIIVGNMNFQGLSSEFLWDMNDFLHYADKMEAIIVSEFSFDLEEGPLAEKITGRKHEVGILGFIQGGYRYSIGMDRATAKELLLNQLKEKTLIVKWGLYEPGSKHIVRIPGTPPPTVVIYNSVNDLDLRMENWLPSHKGSYIHIGISEDHFFQTFIMKDEDGILHLVNSKGNKAISDFIAKYRSSLSSSQPQDLISNPKDYNNTVSVWMGLSWDIDWFNTMVRQKELVPRVYV